MVSVLVLLGTNAYDDEYQKEKRKEKGRNYHCVSKKKKK